MYNCTHNCTHAFMSKAYVHVEGTRGTEKYRETEPEPEAEEEIEKGSERKHKK